MPIEIPTKHVHRKKGCSFCRIKLAHKIHRKEGFPLNGLGNDSVKSFFVNEYTFQLKRRSFMQKPSEIWKENVVL
ncbi:hypothetical protein SAMN05421807_103116 [Virgibacillus chiguensis]|uniref:Transposase n=1 Tax=Virgibacillus chiguensis TaxID=411959 RepID=A0A1M5PLD1_9BACI|nr:hypothetical protein SAMN05421807_103116 [Virgibacillus chiguensis]